MVNSHPHKSAVDSEFLDAAFNIMTLLSWLRGHFEPFLGVGIST